MRNWQAYLILLLLKHHILILGHHYVTKKIQAMFSYIHTIGMFYLPRKYEAQSLILKSCFEIAPLQKLFFVALIVSTQLIQWDKGKKYTRPA